MNVPIHTCPMSLCFFNLYTEHNMRNDGLNEFKLELSDLWMLPINGWKQRGTKEPLDEGEGGEWKSWLKAKY